MADAGGLANSLSESESASIAANSASQAHLCFVSPAPSPRAGDEAVSTSARVSSLRKVAILVDLKEKPGSASSLALVALEGSEVSNASEVGGTSSSSSMSPDTRELVLDSRLVSPKASEESGSGSGMLRLRP